MHPRIEAAAILVGRLMLASLFILEGVSKLRGYPGAEAYIARFGMPAALLPAAIALEIGGGLLLAAGIYVRCVGIALAIFCLVAAGVFHTNFALRGEVLHFEKDIALAGALLMIAFCASDRLSILQLFRSRPPG